MRYIGPVSEVGPIETKTRERSDCSTQECLLVSSERKNDRRRKFTIDRNDRLSYVSADMEKGY